MNIVAGSITVDVNTLLGKVWVNADTFYTVSSIGNVALWNVEGDQAFQLCIRNPGTSGKDAATIARDMLNAD